MRRVMLFSDVTQNAPFDYTFTGNRVVTVAADGTVTNSVAGVYRVWHYVRLTGTFTSPLSTIIDVEFHANTSTALVSPFLASGSIERQVLKEVRELKLEYEHEVEAEFNKRFIERVSGESSSKLLKKIQMLEELLDIANDRKEKTEKKEESVVRPRMLRSLEDDEYELSDFRQTPPPSLRSKPESKANGLGLLKK